MQFRILLKVDLKCWHRLFVFLAIVSLKIKDFVDGNINYLIDGQDLKIPSFEYMMLVDKNAAKKKSAEDTQNFQNKSPKKSKAINQNVNKKEKMIDSDENSIIMQIYQAIKNTKDEELGADLLDVLETLEF